MDRESPERVIGPASRTDRLPSIDLLRGIVIVVMALDHSREFFTNLPFQPEDLAQTFPVLFFTRWITHFCAPVFFLLAGTGAFFHARRTGPGQSLSRFLWTRGIGLVVLELTVIDFAFTFSTRFHVGIVIWTLGWSMIVLALLVRLHPWAIASIAGAMILLHNTLDPFQPGGGLVGTWVYGFFHRPTVGMLGDGRMVGLLYPLVPWAGVMAAGYLMGYVCAWDACRRRRVLTGAGLAVTLAFVVLRATNLYGDPQPWSTQPSPLMTAVSFLNCSKYPPSLCFLLMTLGPCLVFLGQVDDRVSRFVRPLVVFGRVPLFFFVVHLYVLHLLAIVVALVGNQPVEWLWHGAVLAQRPDGYGQGLPFVYAVWVAVTVVLYPACAWYAGVKRRYPGGILSYL